MAPGYDGWFRIDYEGYTSAKTTMIHGEPGEEYPEETVILYGTGGIEGRIVDSTGNPMANAIIRVSLNAEGLTYLAPRSGQIFRARDLDQTDTNANGYFAIGYGFPAVVGDAHIDVFLEDKSWRELAIVNGVEITQGHVSDLGDIVVSLE
jgi:hypothetical protein